MLANFAFIPDRNCANATVLSANRATRTTCRTHRATGTAPAPISAPTEQYGTTPWGTRCQVSTDEIIRDTYEPGLVLNTPGGADCPGPSFNELVVDTSGTSQPPAAGVILPASPCIQQLAERHSYHVNG